MTKPLSEILADYVLDYSLAKQDGRAKELALLFIKDCFGCMLAGAHEEAVTIALQ